MVQMIRGFLDPLERFNIISHQDDLELSDIVQPCQFETLEIESDTGSHHSAIDHDRNNEGER